MGALPTPGGRGNPPERLTHPGFKTILALGIVSTLVAAGALFSMGSSDLGGAEGQTANLFSSIRGTDGTDSLAGIGAEVRAEWKTVPTTPKIAKFLSGAYAQVGITVGYDPEYRKIPFPGGDVPIETGVCSDVVVRTFRNIGTDLQKDVNADISADFSSYPTKYGLSVPDPNIDHRRVPNLMRFFERKGWSVPISGKGAEYLPGDVVAWEFPGNRTHIGIVSDRTLPDGTPLVIDNSGRGTVVEDLLFQYPIIGHYRAFGM